MKILETILRRVDECQRTDQPRPAYLQKQVDAVYLSKTDPTRGLAMLMDGLRDEDTHLRKAKLKKYPLSTSPLLNGEPRELP